MADYMKAAIAPRYGPPSILSIEEVPKPIPKEDELLVRVHATTVNRTDCGTLRAKPFVVRFFAGLMRPHPILGIDFAGQVMAVGAQVTNFKVGDRVFGLNDNGLASHAEYLTISETAAVATMPSVSYAAAAASLEGAHYAYNFITKVNLEAGQKALVYGATGAIGSAAVQLLKFFGITVTAVGGTAHLKLLSSLGADKVIDWQREDFTQDNERYHFVFDAVGKSTFGKCTKLLEPGGVYISSDLGPGGQNIFLALFTPLFGKRKVFFPLPRNCKRSVLFLKERIEEGAFQALIDKKYDLAHIVEAYQYVETGQKVGNVVIEI